MMMTLAELRANLYRSIDQVLKTRQPLEIMRKGKRLKISVIEAPDKLSLLKKRRNVIQGDPEELVHLDWSHTWN